MGKKSQWNYLDTPFSEAIRRRAMIRVGGCEKCKRGKTSYKELDCAHFYNRNTFATRWNDENCIGLCGGCHFYLDTHKDIFRAWMRKQLGRRRFRLLEIQSQQRGKTDKAAVGLYIKDLLKRMKEARL